jgi:hypothetical protein
MAIAEVRHAPRVRRSERIVEPNMLSLLIENRAEPRDAVE